MKKSILFLFVGIFLVGMIGGVLADNCQLATPRYGVVQCIDMQQKETIPPTPLVFSSCEDGAKCSLQLPCLSNCKLIESNAPGWSSPLNWPNSCSFPNERKFEIIKNGNSLGAVSNTEWGRDDNLIVSAWCQGPFGGIYSPPAETSIQYSQEEIMLEEGWGGSMPTTPVTGSEGCVLNKNYDTTNINSYLDPTTGQTNEQDDYSPSTHSSLSQFPNNWKIGDHFIFIKNWQTGIADISLTYDKQNNSYWCGGQIGSRIIYNVQNVTSQTGNCYAVPQSVYESNVECCFPPDCANNPNYGPQYTCNPDDWKCEKTKPCNSELDCEQTFGEGVCQNNQINQWTCDLTKKWGDYAGTCVHSSKQVTNCPSDCKSNQYYNEEQGKCLTREGAVTQTNANQSSLTGKVSSSFSQNSSSTGITILVIFLVLIGGSIGFFVSTKNKNKKLKHEIKKDFEEHSKKCKKCGQSLKQNSKFCTKCGKRQ